MLTRDVDYSHHDPWSPCRIHDHGVFSWGGTHCQYLHNRPSFWRMLHMHFFLVGADEHMLTQGSPALH